METIRNGTLFSTRAPTPVTARNVTEIVCVSHQDITELTIIVCTVGTLFSTKAPTRVSARNVTEIVYVSHQDITELTIIVWTVGGVLLIVLLSLLGRIMLARKKDPFTEAGYERRRNNVFRIRLDSTGYHARPAEHGFVVPCDTNELVSGDATPPMESPVSQRYYFSRRHTTQGNPRQGIPQNSINNITTVLSTVNQTQVVDHANSLNSNTRSNTVSRNNVIDLNAGSCDRHEIQDDNCIPCRCVYDAESNEGTTRECFERISQNTLPQPSDSAIISNTASHVPQLITTGHHHQNSAQLQSSENQPNGRTVHTNNADRPQQQLHTCTQTQTQTQSIGTTGSRVVLSNGVVICPPPYCDVINSSARLPSVVVSRPSRPPVRRLLFSL